MHKDREPVDTEHVRCLDPDCGKVFVPRKNWKPPKHGSFRGYERHYRKRTGSWSWPPCSLCVLAHREWRQEYTTRSEVIKDRKARSVARMASFVKLRKLYPAAYLELYRAELERLGMQEVKQRYQVPVWESILDKLALAATGLSEPELENQVRTRKASRQQTEVIRQVRRLRMLLAVPAEEDQGEE